ncbi:UNVERIFIED_CONTAM: hypothetical protein GTU68_064286 [Idotea baltica]|nr:hypothetical protein [Idotea baltica]
MLIEGTLSDIWVEGEISNLAKPASGHIYFTLKDKNSQVRCALFRQYSTQAKKILANGLSIKVRGKASLFAERGDYQLILTQVDVSGDGLLNRNFELLKEKLIAEGLFSTEHKKELPIYPKKIGVITSASGAVIRDILTVFQRRAPYIAITVIPSPVQGEEATQKLIASLKLADKQHFDALILARGGGSIEDLWCFNEEAIARQIFSCKTPIISAIGHETDITISDFVADLRAPTPSAAAELLAPNVALLLQQITRFKQQLISYILQKLEYKNLQLDSTTQRIRHPIERLQQQKDQLAQIYIRLKRAKNTVYTLKLEQLKQLSYLLNTHRPDRLLIQRENDVAEQAKRLQKAIQRTFHSYQLQLQSQAQTLQAVSPLAILNRGYSIISDEQSQPISHTNQVHEEQILTAKLASGSLKLQVITYTKN